MILAALLVLISHAGASSLSSQHHVAQRTSRMIQDQCSANEQACLLDRTCSWNLDARGCQGTCDARGGKNCIVFDDACYCLCAPDDDESDGPPSGSSSPGARSLRDLQAGTCAAKNRTACLEDLDCSFDVDNSTCAEACEPGEDCIVFLGDCFCAPPPAPSGAPSNAPSESGVPSKSPSASDSPTSAPSEAPSGSAAPADEPSDGPSSSDWPTSMPSESPSVSAVPSYQPSIEPTRQISRNPSSSDWPTSPPSESPSVSVAPSPRSSESPSTSDWPTRVPSESPSVSAAPSTSTAPTLRPSTKPSLSARPTVSQAPSLSKNPSLVPSLVPTNSGAPTSNAPALICGTMFEDPNKDGIMQDAEARLPNITVALWCAQNGQPAANVDAQVTDANGFYAFHVPQPGNGTSCFVGVETAGYAYSPAIVPGGNQLDSDGRSPDVNVNRGDVIYVDGGLCLQTPAPTTRPPTTHPKMAIPTTSPTPLPTTKGPTPPPSPVPTASPTPLPSPAPTASPSASTPALICGTMFEDPDKDGEQDPGEGGLPHVAVALWCAQNGQPAAKVGTQITDATGFYAFSVSQSGSGPSCFVRVDTPGYLFSPVKVAGGNQLGPNGRSDAVNVNPGVTIYINGGLCPRTPAPTTRPPTTHPKMGNPTKSPTPLPSHTPTTRPTTLIPTLICGTMFEDLDKDGEQDPGEGGLPNIAVALWCAQNGQPAAKVGTQITDAAGFYAFDLSQPGSGLSCFVQVETPGYLFSPVKVAGGNQLGPNGRSDAVNINPRVTIYINGGLCLATPAPTTRPPTAHPKMANPTKSPTPLPSPAPTTRPTTFTPTLICGTMFEDLDKDGEQDPGEGGLPNIVVALWCAQNGQPAAKVGTQITDAAGFYAFDLSQPGSGLSCFVRVETPGYLFSPVKVAGGNQLGPNGRSDAVNVNPGVTIYIDGGLCLATSAPTTRPPTTHPKMTSHPVTPAPTTRPPTAHPKMTSHPARPVPTKMPTPLPTPVPTNHPSPSTPGLICGTLFEDLDKDGKQDPGEGGLPNVVVALWCAQNGHPAAKVDTQTTDNTGFYAFHVDQPGSCYIQVESTGYLYSPVLDPPSGNQLDSNGRSPDVNVNNGDVIYINGGLCVPTPATISGTMFGDPNQDGMQDPGEGGLQNIVVALWCGSNNGQPVTKVATTTTDSSGFYTFSVGQPGMCYIQVETDGYLYSPVVTGGNQLGPDGRSPVFNANYGSVIDYLDGGLYLPFTNTCVGHCNQNEVIQDCGWGIWNECTCQCDCDPGFCLSANQKCYDGCTTHLNFNPFGGCRPGIDCPWFPHPLGETHCTSSANFAGIYNLHETAKKCCQEHFSAQNTNSCAQSSVADVEAEETLVQDMLDRPRYFWPDLHGKKNCVFDSGYNVWMEEQFDFYLFDTETGCCNKWYPTKSDCPDLESPTTPLQLDYKPDVSQQFYYPHLSESNCRFGRNYPMWMNMSPKHYLFTTPEQCCSEWYPSNSNCPMVEDDGVQERFYWQVDEAFYPNFKGDFCAKGNSYPEWMADPMNRETHLFQTAKECCDCWFPDTTAECQHKTITVIDGKRVARPDVTGTWYPALNSSHECINGTPPSWMTQSEGYKMAYVFDSHAECCKAHRCEPQRQTFD